MKIYEFHISKIIIHSNLFDALVIASVFTDNVVLSRFLYVTFYRRKLFKSKRLHEIISGVRWKTVSLPSEGHGSYDSWIHHTTRTSHTTREYIGRLVITLDNLYQAVVLDMLGGLNRFLQYKITNCSNNRTISQNTFTVFARHLYSTLCSWIITFTCTRNFLAKISNVWGKKMVVSLVRGTGCTTCEYITRLVNILDDSRESYDSWIH